MHVNFYALTTLLQISIISRLINAICATLAAQLIQSLSPLKGDTVWKCIFFSPVVPSSFCCSDFESHRQNPSLGESGDINSTENHIIFFLGPSSTSFIFGPVSAKATFFPQFWRRFSTETTVFRLSVGYSGEKEKRDFLSWSRRGKRQVVGLFL